MIYNLGPTTILLSDGCGYDNGKVTSLNTRKVWTLSESVGLIWMGRRFGPIDKIIDSQKGRTAENALKGIGEILKHTINGNEEIEEFLDNDNPYNIFSLEYNNGLLEIYRLFWCKERYNPIHYQTFEPGMNAFMAVEQGKTEEGMALFKKFLKDKTDRTAFSVKSITKAIHDSFSDTIKKLKDQGVQVGGQIFIDTLVVPKEQKEIKNGV